MKAHLLMLSLVFCAASCEREQFLNPVSVNYEYSFPTEPQPIAIAIGNNHGYVYILNYYPSIHNYSSKIQKYSSDGTLLKTSVDFATFNQGTYSRYTPADICTDMNDNYYVLVKPLQHQTADFWSSFEGFCILQFDEDDNFHKEYDFAVFEDHWHPSALAYSANYLFITNGCIIKKISLDSDYTSDIHIQSDDDTLACLMVSDMAVNQDGAIYLTGQGILTGLDSFNCDVSGCHISKFNPRTNQFLSYYSNARTGIMAAMLNNPGLTISRAGNLYLVTFYGMSLEVFDRNDESILQTDVRTVGGDETRPIDTDLLDNRVYIVDHHNNQVHVYKEYY